MRHSVLNFIYTLHIYKRRFRIIICGNSVMTGDIMVLISQIRSCSPLLLYVLL